MKLLSSLPVCLALILGASSPAGATHDGIHPTFKTSNAYIHCTGSTKISQATWLEGILNGGTGHNMWNATPPSQSVTAGAGCGGLDWGGTTNPLYDTGFEGYFTGNLRDVTVRLYSLPIDPRATGPQQLRLNGWIDGVPIFPPGAQPNNGRVVTVTPVRSSTAASDLWEFSITNLGYAIDIFDEEGNLVDVETGGMALEDADGVTEHNMVLYVGLHGTAFGQDPNGHKVGAWVWDTTEVPSGLVFNPPTLAAAKVAADLPDFSGEA